MASVRRFEDLEVWREARALVHAVYLATQRPAFARDFGLRDQIRRAAVSIPSNVAEGFERGGDREFARFLRIAKGSAGEVRTQLYLAGDLGYLSEADLTRLLADAERIARRLGALIRHLDRPTGVRDASADYAFGDPAQDLPTRDLPTRDP